MRKTQLFAAVIFAAIVFAAIRRSFATGLSPIPEHGCQRGPALASPVSRIATYGRRRRLHLRNEIVTPCPECRKKAIPVLLSLRCKRHWPARSGCLGHRWGLNRVARIIRETVSSSADPDHRRHAFRVCACADPRAAQTFPAAERSVHRT